MPENISIAAKGETVLTFPEMCGDDSVVAFSTRIGGVSGQPLHSLNFSSSQGDSRHNVRENLRIFASELGINPDEIVTCRQIHGDHVEAFHSVTDSPPEADALITEKPGLFLGIKTADCLPILITDRRRRIAAAVHAGWRGTVKRITRKVVRLLKRHYGCDPTDITAALGPSIGPCCYEVDETVLVPFRERIPFSERFIILKNHSAAKKSFRLDLALANSYELTAEGVPEENIRTTGLCTSCNPDLFYSYRRDGPASGRHLAVVGFRR